MVVLQLIRELAILAVETTILVVAVAILVVAAVIDSNWEPILLQPLVFSK